MKLQLSLDLKSIQKALEDIEDYKKTLAYKRTLFLERLLDEGITVAEQNKGAIGKYILFRKEIEDGTNQSVGILIGENTQTIKSEWIVKDDTIKTAELSPILFAEFGSGRLAEVMFNDISEVGQGTFPGQTHAFDPEGWWYMDAKDKKWHHSVGFKPTHPMYYAEMAMIEKIQAIAREVFA